MPTSQTATAQNARRPWWSIGLALGGGLLLASALRFGILEDRAQDLLCRQGGGGFWCLLRSGLGLSIHYQLFGLTALALGLISWLPKLRRLALAGLLLAACALMLYNVTYGALALVISLLAALQTDMPPGPRHA